MIVPPGQWASKRLWLQAQSTLGGLNASAGSVQLLTGPMAAAAASSQLGSTAPRLAPAPSLEESSGEAQEASPSTLQV